MHHNTFRTARGSSRCALNLTLPKETRAELAPLQEQAAEQAERDALNRAIENAQMVIEAAEKLPPAAEKKGKKKS